MTDTNPQPELLHELHGLEDGLPMHVYTGTGHSDEQLIATVAETMYEDVADLVGYQLGVSEGRWGWTPRFKHCENYDSGWPCDQAGDWHRHFSPGYGTERVTVVTVYGPSWRPSPHPDVRLIEVKS